LDKEEGKDGKEDLDFGQLVPVLEEGEGFEHLVAMCAPHSTFPGAKNRLKLVPGTCKKGKAARNAILWFRKNLEAEPDRKAIELLDEQEVINVLPSNVRLAGAGILKQEL
jgi:hypothetical protein